MTNTKQILKIGLMLSCIRGFAMQPDITQPTQRNFCGRVHHFIFQEDKALIELALYIIGPIGAVHYLITEPQGDFNWLCFVCIFVEIGFLFGLTLFLISIIRVCFGITDENGNCGVLEHN